MPNTEHAQRDRDTRRAFPRASVHAEHTAKQSEGSAAHMPPRTLVRLRVYSGTNRTIAIKATILRFGAFYGALVCLVVCALFRRL